MSYEELEWQSQTSEKNKRIQKLYAETEDRGYNVLVRKNKQGITKKVPCYASGAQGTSIRNAITGERIFAHKVGSNAEDFYFKVMICTGESKTGDPLTLFYESPEHYERHLFETVDNTLKKKWQERLGKRLVKSHPRNTVSFVEVK